MFAHLHVHSPYSFLDGATRLDRLIEQAALLGMPALALTDHNNLSGAVRHQVKAQAAGIKPIQGTEVTLEGGAHLTLLATGPQGWSSLCRIVTAAHLGDAAGVPPQGAHDLLYRRRMAMDGEQAPDEEEESGTPDLSRRYDPQAPMAALSRHSAGLIALSGCRRGEVPGLILRGRYAEARAAAERYVAIFGRANFFLELVDSRLPGDRSLHRSLRELAAALKIGLVATADVHYRDPTDFPVHDLLTCIRTNSRLVEAHLDRKLNAENWLKSPALMAERFRHVPEAITNTLAIAERCEPALDLKVRLHPAFAVPTGQTAAGMLRELTYQGARRRYRRLTLKIEQRLEHELSIITQLGFCDYFLLVWDVARYARSQAIRYAGRGSAADSAVAYCLFITEVDSIGRGLLFERFLSLERAEMPDIDIDFDARHRDEVAAYVYQKYGREHVAAVGAFNTFQARSAIRDLGKAMDFDPALIDALAKRMPFFAGADQIAAVAERLPELRTAGLPWAKLQALIDAAGKVAGYPRFLGTHMCGLVISAKPLTEVTPLQWAAKGVVVSQFDKEYVEDLGLIKLDLLSLRTLGAMDDAIRLTGRPEPDYPEADPETYQMLAEGDTIGVFQLESPAQRALQSRLGAERFEDVVASVALIRPGPIQGNMVEPYLARREGREEITYLHPALEPILAKTYGVVLFQEQVIEIATSVAGFTPGEADTLRRVMTKARNKEDMVEIGKQFVTKARDRGITDEVAQTIFSYVQGYAGYGFCEAHAAAFANTAYKTAYLVRHHPAEFFASLLSNQPMGYYPPGTLAQEARRRGVGILPVDINLSTCDFTVEHVPPELWADLWPGGVKAAPVAALPPERGEAIRVSLAAIKGVGADVAARILDEREAHGFFTGLPDLAVRLHGQLNRSHLEALIEAGALDGLTDNRRRLLWQLAEMWQGGARFASAAPAGQVTPGAEQQTLGLPGATAPTVPEVADYSLPEKFLREYERVSIMVRGHVMQFERPRLKNLNFATAADLKQLEQGDNVRLAGVVLHPHRPPTKSGKIVVFFSLEDETGMADVVMFEDVYQRFGQHIFTSPRPPLAVLGRVERRGKGTSIIAWRVKPLHEV